MGNAYLVAMLEVAKAEMNGVLSNNGEPTHHAGARHMKHMQILGITRAAVGIANVVGTELQTFGVG